jgi:hypothetical protein
VREDSLPNGYILPSPQVSWKMHNGLKYEARLSNGEVEMVTTDSDLIENIKQSASPKKS